MRAVTIAAAGAAVFGSVSASSHVKHMHAQLHNNVARDTWLDWNSSSTVDPATEVDGGSTTTTTRHRWSNDPETDVHGATTSTTTKRGGWPATTTSSKVVDPATTTSAENAWEDWASTTTSSKPVDPTGTSTDPDYTWADWESSTSSKPVDPTGTSTEPDHTWGDWTEATTTVTLKSTITTTKYVAPISTEDPTWADWEATTSTEPAAVTSKPVAPVTSVVTSTIVPGWSQSGWFGPSWSLAPGSCAVSVITSYGLPTWRPVADATTTTTTTTNTWEDWAASSTTSSPAAATTTTSSYDWADWTSTVPVAPATSTTDDSTWSDWTLTAPTEAATTTGGGWGVPSSSASATGSSTWPKPSGSGGRGGGYPGITPNGDSWGMTYSPYTAQGGCKDAWTVAKDFAIIAGKGFTTVRVYSTDCDTLENFGKSARDNGLKLILGVWISSSGIGAAKGQVDDIVAWGQWDLVELIVVGNEVVFNNIASASDLAGFISSSTWAFKSAGYTGPVTTTEPLSVWEDTKNAAILGGVIDVVGANLYAFFNAQVSASGAGKFIQDQINILNSIFAGKPIYVLESGWPHTGNANGAAVPSRENQAIALKGIQAAVGAQVVFLSYEDEPWKEPGQFGVEQFWGCAGVF